MITLKEAENLIAPHVEEVEGGESLRRIINLGVEAAWNTGRWWDMQDVFYLETMENLVVLPEGYSTLVAITADGAPARIRSRFHEFHQNGNTTCSGWSSEVEDRGDRPTAGIVRELGRIGVRRTGIEDSSAVITVDGMNADGDLVQSFVGEERINGERFILDKDDLILSAFKWAKDGVTSITKPVTNYPVEIYDVAEDNSYELIASISPRMTEARFRKYTIPGWACGCPVLRGLCKKRLVKPQAPTDSIPVSSEAALVNLGLYAYHMYFTQSLQKAQVFMQEALNHLNGQLGEMQGDPVRSIQVQNEGGYNRDYRTNPLTWG